MKTAVENKDEGMIDPGSTPEPPITAKPFSQPNLQIAALESAQTEISKKNIETGVEKEVEQQITTQETQAIQLHAQTSDDPNRSQLLQQQQMVSSPVVSDRSLPLMDLFDPASFGSTTKAAEQWRQNWRDRQYAEAGPAETVSRGQASVSAPLSPLQQSFVRMRAILINDTEKRGNRSIKPISGITIFLMICLIIGLGFYIIFSFYPSPTSGKQTISSSSNPVQPTLILPGSATNTVSIGQSMQLHGTQFGSNQTIVFLRDLASPIIDSSGKNISKRTDSQGRFVVTIPIDTGWSVGSHSIEALNQSDNQRAFLTIQIILSGTATTSSTDLSVSILGKPASQLNFMSARGIGNPAPQQITITNTSASPLQWTATTSTNNNMHWLQINDNNEYGHLAISQPYNMFISVNTTGLRPTDKNHPYLGQIIFTINNTQLLTLPVQLQIIDSAPEMVLSPNPIIAHIGAGNTCPTGVSLTLINLGTATIRYAVNPDLTDKIRFMSNGQLLDTGTLLPSGSLLPSSQPGDTVVLTLQCNNVKSGQTYHVSVYANQLSWSLQVIVLP